jgi:mono/diheme cytochrome c family protein
MMKKFFVRLAAIVGTLAVLAGLGAWYIIANSPINRTYADAPGYAVAISYDDPEAIERGRYITEAVAVCTICHGDNLGGAPAFNDDFLGSVHTPNLTTGEGGVGAYYTEEDWVRAIRYGVHPGGRGLIFMPSDSYFHLTDEDLGAMVAYLMSLPPVDNTEAARNLTIPAQVMLSLGASGQVARTELIDFTGPRPELPEYYGEYLVQIGGCSFCHGDDLRGGQGLEPGAPPGTNLHVGGPLDDYTLEDFDRVMRTGVMIDGDVIDPIYMPWAGYNNMTDEDIEAIWEYLRSLE